jgi:hypothetical protein
VGARQTIEQSAPRIDDLLSLSSSPISGVDESKVDDTVLALLWLTFHDERRVLEGLKWDTLARLDEKGMIGDPVGRTKSVVLTDEGL